MTRTRTLLASALCLLSGWATAQTINSPTPPIPPPIQPTDTFFCFRGSAPVYSCSVATLLSGLTTGVYGPGSSTDNYVPQWNGLLGNSLKAGLPVGTTGNSTIVETNGSGKIDNTILSTAVTLLGNVTTGSGSTIVLSTTPTFSPTGVYFAGSTSGSVNLLASPVASGSFVIPSGSGSIVTTADRGTVTATMLASVTGSGNTVVLSQSPHINSPVFSGTLSLTGGSLQFGVLPTGTPRSYACFDGANRLVSSVFPC